MARITRLAALTAAAVFLTAGAAYAVPPVTNVVVTDISYIAPTDDTYQMERCKVDVSSPRGATNLPVLIFFHAGGFVEGKRHFPGVNRNEMVVVAAGYRLSPQVTYPAFIEDAAAAVAWAVQHAQEYGGDPKKIFVSGHSAGGYLAAMVGMDPRWLKPYGLSPGYLAGIIPISAQVTTHFRVKSMLKIEGETYRPLITPEAPLYYCSRRLPPICIITGDSKIEWPCRVQENELMAASLRALGHPSIEFHELSGKDHGSVEEGVDEIIRNFMARSGPSTKSLSGNLKESAGGSGRSDGGAVTSARQDQQASPRRKEEVEVSPGKLH